MKGSFRAAKITEKVYWVGAVDWALRDFHGYTTARGSTYNAYLVLADKVTLIDTVKYDFKDEMLARIRSVIDPAAIQYIVSNHAEMDHSGCLPEVVELVKPQKVFTSVVGAKALPGHFPSLADRIEAVKDGQTIDLGSFNLSFCETRMLHWPESMFTYVPQEYVLFSQDMFGSHLASNERFADEVGQDVLRYEAAKYFANIFWPYASFVQKTLDRLRDLGWDLNILATDHGPIWRRPADIDKILELYTLWAQQRPTKKALVVYDTMWQSTAAMARAVGEGLTAGGTQAVVMPIRATTRSDIATELLEAGALLIGTPTINNNMFPTVADVLVYLKGLRPRNLVGAVFGSYGWGGEALKQVAGELEQMKVELVAEPLRVQYVPDEEALERCRALGEQVAAKLLQRCCAAAR